MNEAIHAYLCPPGNGVFTVNTGKEKKQWLHQHLYQTNEQTAVDAQFKQQLKQLSAIETHQTALLGLCSDTGGGILRGANWGPLFIREKLYLSGYKNKLIELGDIRVIPHLLHDKYLNQATISGCQKALYGSENQLAVSPLSIAEDCISQLYNRVDNFKLFALGGDHSVSYPLVKTYLKAKKQQGKKAAIIHFDAHTDLLIDRLGIDLCFGSWLTHVLPFLDCPSLVHQFGIRSTGKSKTHWQETFGVNQHWSEEIQQLGIDKFCQIAIKALKEANVDELYISFDIDALDSRLAPSTGTPEPNGLTIEQATTAIDYFNDAFAITGADLVEVAPLTGNETAKDKETTLDSANKVASALINAICL